MLSAADNELLTRTGADTPMGQYFRRFWQPVALSREVPEPDCVPIQATVMGEKLVVFRDSQGKVGVLDSRCPHRGANLCLGRNEDGGLRCVFHGWKFDVQGKAMELPNVPPGSNYHKTIRAKSYPAREFGDVVWAWMGPAVPDGQPLPGLPQLEFAVLPAGHRYVMKKLQECNWAQSLEGAIDTSHFSFLHMPAPSVPANTNPDAPADEKRLRWIREDPLPQFAIIEHEVGFVVGGARRADPGERYWRTAQFALPAHSTTPSTLPGEMHFGYTWVPIDDTSCWIYTYAWNPERPFTPAERAKLAAGHGVIAEVDENFVPLRNRSNNYLIDRQAQKHSSFTGVRGVAEQDAMVHDSQGFIADRTREHLTAADVAIVRFRRKMLDGARLLEGGTEPKEPWLHERYCLRSGSYIAPEGMSMEEVMRRRFGDPQGWVARSAVCET